MSMYSFELHFLASAGEDVIDGLYEAGWDDAVVSLDPLTGGEGVAAFGREAPSAVHAVASAIQEGGNVGVRITGMVELSEADLELAQVCEVADAMIRSRNLQEKLPAPDRKTLADVVAAVTTRLAF